MDELIFSSRTQLVVFLEGVQRRVGRRRGEFNKDGPGLARCMDLYGALCTDSIPRDFLATAR